MGVAAAENRREIQWAPATGSPLASAACPGAAVRGLFADAGRADDDEVAGAADPVGGGQRREAVADHPGVKAEVEADRPFF